MKGSKVGCLLEIAWWWGALSGPSQDYVGSGCVPGVKPNVVRSSVLERQFIVELRASADPDVPSTRGLEAPIGESRASSLLSPGRPHTYIG